MKKNNIFVALAFLIPLCISLFNIFQGNLPFWSDSARDLLLGWDNLHKISLIGPTSGIEGIFYGPYWIWLLSFGLLFSKDPRIVSLIIGVLSYFVIFPIFLFKFSKIFDKKTLILIWLLFMFSSGIPYTLNIWSPHLAPLLFLILIYFLTAIDYVNNKKSNFVNAFLAGVFGALVVNFNISFGLGLFLGIFLSFVIIYFMQIKNNQNQWKQLLFNGSKIILFYLFGVFVICIPFLIFELRHNFHQINTAITALIKYGAVNNQTGLTKIQILESFFNRLGILLHIKPVFAYLIELILFIFFFVKVKFHKLKLTAAEKKLSLFLFFISLGVLFIYLTARNPVWEYHFISAEIIFLFLIALVINKIPVLKNIIFILVIFIVTSAVIYNIKNTKIKYSDPVYLSTKEYITNIIINDSKGRSYNVFNYNPSIYQFEYAYLFKWKAHKDFSYDPGNIPKDNNLVYLIIPKTDESIKNNHIQFFTPGKIYKTTKTWTIPDQSVILRRDKI